MFNIYIGKEQGNKVLGLIVAKNKDIAWTYFEAQYGTVDDVEEIDVNTLNDTRPYYKLISTSKVITSNERGLPIEVRKIKDRKEIFLMVTLITGPMYSSKSTELLRYLERAKIGKKEVCLVRPMTDNREFFSHSVSTQTLYNKMEIPVYLLPKEDTSEEYALLLQKINKEYEVIGIDECQFVSYLDTLTFNFIVHHKEVYMSGLLATSECKMFEPIQKVLPFCDYIKKLNAVCSVCGSDVANYTHYKEGSKTTSIEIGGSDKYDALCQDCYFELI